jgi:hypothetical protein
MITHGVSGRLTGDAITQALTLKLHAGEGVNRRSVKLHGGSGELLPGTDKDRPPAANTG